MRHLTFEPLSRNRYRVRGSGMEKDPIVKKAQIESFSRNFYGRLRSAARQEARRAELELPKVHISAGYAQCPSCNHGNWTRPGKVQCEYCKITFQALPPKFF